MYIYCCRTCCWCGGRALARVIVVVALFVLLLSMPIVLPIQCYSGLFAHCCPHDRQTSAHTLLLLPLEYAHNAERTANKTERQFTKTLYRLAEASANQSNAYRLLSFSHTVRAFPTCANTSCSTNAPRCCCCWPDHSYARSR